tara:strand:+ start:84 stop:284 length:201 start_codon:yes stop_codon:yes gene_type:complete
MDGIGVIQFLKKVVHERRDSAVEVLAHNGISDMQQYHCIMGELNALTFIEQELMRLLKNKQEPDDD